jgi:hypothetical protein
MRLSGVLSVESQPPKHQKALSNQTLRAFFVSGLSHAAILPDGFLFFCVGPAGFSFVGW